MENKIKYVQLSSDNKEKCAVFEKMMAAYVKELDELCEAGVSPQRIWPGDVPAAGMAVY